jgi:hypothetical protein
MKDRFRIRFKFGSLQMKGSGSIQNEWPDSDRFKMKDRLQIHQNGRSNPGRFKMKVGSGSV